MRTSDPQENRRMVLTLTEAIRAIKEGKAVFAHLGDGKYPPLTINDQDELLIGGRGIKASEMSLIFESEEDPSWLLMQVLHALMRGSEEVFETVGKQKASAYISGGDEQTRLITLAVPRFSTHALTAQWVRLP